MRDIIKIELTPSEHVVGLRVEKSWQFQMQTFEYKGEGSPPVRYEKQEGTITDNSSTTLLEALRKLTLEIEQLQGGQ